MSLSTQSGGNPGIKAAIEVVANGQTFNQLHTRWRLVLRPPIICKDILKMATVAAESAYGPTVTTTHHILTTTRAAGQYGFDIVYKGEYCSDIFYSRCVTRGRRVYFSNYFQSGVTDILVILSKLGATSPYLHKYPLPTFEIGDLYLHICVSRGAVGGHFALSSPIPAPHPTRLEADSAYLDKYMCPASGIYDREAILAYFYM
ncbi:hypothetical protein PILCRDRAFT_88378 [Piloderma croceum F 1598]|uniref:Uncharacterized protein n=1 Tax=Piloderma croceum (strain F 1598) TaxID=765440 RepID=A0A0C3B8T0_PILCF|nr:hypothetical protein PILCRDRAFT_93363 [Piloderma croceum F 1598]KIM82683.1 hypothetical protein PILCRDRAFT_88378 [Piloderma croceum F 1598]